MNDHYFSKKPTSRLKINKINVTINNISFKFDTGSGIFSIGKADKGSEILVKNTIINDDWKVLDLGCGWGFLGIVIKKLFPKTEVTMSDINERAIKLANDNCKPNNAECRIIQSDLYENINERFNTIISNPPTHAGKDVCYEIIERAPDFLVKGGLLQIVARHQRGGKSLEKKMKETFGNVKATAKKSGFRVYVSEKQ